MLPAVPVRRRRRSRPKKKPPAAPRTDRRQEARRVPPRLRPGAPAADPAERERLREALSLPPAPGAVLRAAWKGPGRKAFVIKSFTEAHVRRSVRHGLWAATAVSSDVLNEAFERSAGEVLLLFSVCASKHFCGAALLSAPMREADVSLFDRPERWAAQAAVRWLCVADAPNHELRALRVPEAGRDVCSLRDGTEVPADVAEAVFAALERHRERSSMLDDWSDSVSGSLSGGDGGAEGAAEGLSGGAEGAAERSEGAASEPEGGGE